MTDTLIKKPDDKVREKLSGTLKASSLGKLVADRKREQETFLLLDYSSSMDDSISMGGRTRKIDALRTVAKDLRDQVTCPQVGFGREVKFITEVPEPSGSTPLADAIEFSRINGAKHLIVVSDGAPNDPDAALREARLFKGPIDVFYVGPEGDGGAEFLAKLAKATAGRIQVTTLSETKALTSAIRGFLPSSTS